MLLQREKIGMSPCSIKGAFRISRLVHEKPVRFDMQFPIWLPVSFESMIAVLLGQRISFQQKQNNIFQLLHIIATVLNFFQITAKLGSINGFTHLDTQLPEKILRILSVKDFLTAFSFLYSLPCQSIGNSISIFLLECRIHIKRSTVISCCFADHQTDGLRKRHTSPAKNLGSGISDGRVNFSSNMSSSGHGRSPCLSKVIESGPIVKPGTFGRASHAIV